MKKVCIICGQELPIELFPTNRRMPDGHLGWCKECFALRTYHPPTPAPSPEIEPVEVCSPKWLPEPQPTQETKPVQAPMPERPRRRGPKPKFTPEERKERARLCRRRNYWANRERKIAQVKAYYEKHKGSEEYRERNRMNAKKYRESEKGRAYMQVYNERRRLRYRQERLERLERQQSEG